MAFNYLDSMCVKIVSGKSKELKCVPVLPTFFTVSTCLDKYNNMCLNFSPSQDPSEYHRVSKLIVEITSVATCKHAMILVYILILLVPFFSLHSKCTNASKKFCFALKTHLYLFPCLIFVIAPD